MVRRVFFVVLACLATLLIAGTDASGAVDLQYKFTAGEVVRHKLVVDIDIALAISAPDAPQIPPMHVKVVGIIKQKTGRILPDGDVEIVDTLESATMTLGNQTKKLPLDKVPPMTGLVSKYGPSNRVSAPDGARSMFSNVPFGNAGMTQYILLPGQPLNVGDYWTDTMNLPLGIGIEQRSKLTAEKSKLGSYIVAVVKQELSGNMDLPLAQLAALAGQVAGTKLPIDGNLKALVVGDVTTYFSVEKGRIIRSEGTLDMQMDADVTDGAQSGQVAVRAHLNFSVNLALK
jgi:hypothetical protein